MLRRAPGRPLRRFSRGRASSIRRTRRWRRAAPRRVAEQQLEERHQVVAVPFACRVRLADPDLPASRDAAEEPRVVDRHRDRRPGAEPALGSARKSHHERPSVEVRESTLEDAEGRPLEQAHPAGARRPAQRALVGRAAHTRSEPLPGTNGGLWWNGTRLSQRRRACQWMSEITCTGISGYRSKRRATEAFVSSRPPAVQDRGQRPVAVLADVDAGEDLVSRLREGVLVRTVEPEEGRDVQVLVVLVAERGPVEKLGQPLAEGVVQLGDHAGERAVAPVAPVEADRVEDVAQHAELRQHQHALDRRVAGELDHRLLQRPVAVEVVGVAEREHVRRIDRHERQAALELGELVEVEKPVRDRVAEDVPRRGPARVQERPGVESGPHQLIPRAAAARDAGGQAVLVEAVAVMRTGVVSVPAARERRQLALGLQRVDRVERMVVGDALDHVLLGDLFVQRHAEVRSRPRAPGACSGSR